MAKDKNQASSNAKEALKILAVLLITGLVLACVYLIPKYCRGQKEKPEIHPAETSGVTVTDSKTGISYTRCPAGIGANTLSDEFLSAGKGEKHIVFYAIEFEDSAEFISEARNAAGGAYVYRAESVPEITLKGFSPVSAGIFMEGISAPIDSFYSKQTAENASCEVEDGYKYVELIENALTNSPEAQLTGNPSDTTYYIRLYSEKYKGLYYETEFFTDVNGAAYLRDAVTGKIVGSPDALTVRITG